MCNEVKPLIGQLSFAQNVNLGDTQQGVFTLVVVKIVFDEPITPFTLQVHS